MCFVKYTIKSIEIHSWYKFRLQRNNWSISSFYLVYMSPVRAIIDLFKIFMLTRYRTWVADLCYLNTVWTYWLLRRRGCDWKLILGHMYLQMDWKTLQLWYRWCIQVVPVLWIQHEFVLVLGLGCIWDGFCIMTHRQWIHNHIRNIEHNYSSIGSNTNATGYPSSHIEQFCLVSVTSTHCVK